MSSAAPTSQASHPHGGSAHPTWHRLGLLDRQLRANLAALSKRDPHLADRLAALEPDAQWLISADAAGVMLATDRGAGAKTVTSAVDPVAAARISAKLFPSAHCTEPVLVAGLDQGWLWNSLYHLPVSTPRAPGHRPPIYLLAKDLERLWAVLHFHDWAAMLADPRTRLFAGIDCLEQLRASMAEYHCYPWPKLCVTVDPSVWPAGENIDALSRRSHESAGNRLRESTQRLRLIYGRVDATDIAHRFSKSGNPLRVLGITSRFTTFLKHSMGDWLAALEALGHLTRTVIETEDAQQTNSLVLAEACESFRPDLILMIDHFRGEFAGLPTEIPCVMWVQDQLPNIFNPRSGAAQQSRDYCLGFGRLMLSGHHGYPARRFMPATVGVNEARFTNAPLPGDDVERFACDVSYVSHASVPADKIVADEIARQTSNDIRKLLANVFDRLTGEYERHGQARHALLIRKMIVAAAEDLKLAVNATDLNTLHDFFTHRVNNALFRHRSLAWFVEAGINLHLYGRGWENHPTLARYARGIADNQSQLRSIYRASKINLQLTPHGAVHQRLMEGLASGGFFLIRRTPGDVIDLVHRPLWEWCVRAGVTTDDSFRLAMTPEVRMLVCRWNATMGVDLFEVADKGVVEHLALSADCEFARSAAAVWDDYDRVSFDAFDDVRQRLCTYLYDAAERRRISASMRQVVLNRFTYRSMSQQLLDFIAADLRAQAADGKTGIAA